MQTHFLALLPNQDILSEIRAFLETQPDFTGVILSGSGDLSTVTLNLAGSEKPVTWLGPFLLISLSGTITPTRYLRVPGISLYATFADSTGLVRGGLLADGSRIATHATIVVGNTQNPERGLQALVTAGGHDSARTPGTLSVSVPNTQNPIPKTAFVLFTDGASKGNPGAAGIGVALFRADDLQNPVKVIADSIEETTNNVAEYKALIRGLHEALLLNVERIEVRTDSQLMAEQVSGRYQIKATNLIPLCEEAKSLLARFASARVIYIPRAQNALADKLANQGIAGKP